VDIYKSKGFQVCFSSDCFQMLIFIRKKKAVENDKQECILYCGKEEFNLTILYASLCYIF